MMEEKTCPNCKHPLHPDAHFCPVCMAVLEPGAAVSPPKPKRSMGRWIAAVCAAALLVAGMGYAAYRMPFDGADSVDVTVWTMKLRPNGGVDSFAFCLEQGIVGFGWGLEGSPATMAEYRGMRAREGAYPGDKSLDRTLDSFENMTTSERTHLVWTRDSRGEYYICEITGAYQYSRDEAHEQAGIVNFAPCKFYSVGRDLVPEAVMKSMEASGVIQFVRGAEPTEITRKLWEIAKAGQSDGRARGSN